jgi:hypothetical protein
MVTFDCKIRDGLFIYHSSCIWFCEYLQIQRPNSWTKFRRKSSEFSSLLFTVTSAALPWDFYFYKLTQPLKVSRAQLLYTVKEKRGKPDRKPYSLPNGFRNQYRDLMSEDSQDHAQKPQRNCMFMNSASGCFQWIAFNRKGCYYWQVST